MDAAFFAACTYSEGLRDGSFKLFAGALGRKNH